MDDIRHLLDKIRINLTNNNKIAHSQFIRKCGLILISVVFNNNARGNDFVTSSVKSQISANIVDRYCLDGLIRQELRDSTNWIFISPTFDKDDMLCELSLNDPALFDFVPYYAFE